MQSFERGDIKRISLGLFIVFFLALHFYLKIHIKPSFEAAGALVGKTAMPFENKTADGTPINLTSIAKSNKLTIVNFWETWCGPCKSEMPDLQNLYSANKDKGLELIGIYQSSSDDAVKQIVKERSLTFPMIHDSDRSITQLYAVEAVPTTVVMDSGMKILRSRAGVDSGLKAFVEDYLSKKGENKK